jgi:ABC-2 type transport system permease protein
MNANVLFAVFKRNFISYFINPTGYVFICVFVLLGSLAAFWSNEFFNANLCNLDQLNQWFPFIMLVFIPAITMSIWADERRQGTDELLLTIPASDADVVLGKYLAAVAIYSVSLLFSMICNYAVLDSLGSPDPGLFLATYFGYWMIGLAMLSIGMVASFLTSNLTMAFIFGALFNAPLVAAVAADVIFPDAVARVIKQASISEQFAGFGRGVVSLSAMTYFILIIALMLYLCMVLIGRRHWYSGRQGAAMAGHHAARAVLLALAVIGLTVVFSRYDFRCDMTSARLSSLSRETRKLLDHLDLERPVQIEAFISPKVPESYVQTRVNLLNMLHELKAAGGNKVQLHINWTEQYSEEAARAEKRYGIEPRQVGTLQRGALSVDNIFLGVAMTSGLQKVIIPFIDRGIPVEYELVRSVATVAKQERKRIGVLSTDAELYGRFNMQTMSRSTNWPIIDELQKQYDVVQVDAAQPITEKYDVLLAVQPSSLDPQQMDNFIAAVENGQPTAIFEDPLPVFTGTPATSAPRRMPGGMNNPMMMMGQRPPEKGDIGKLWRLLGVDFAKDKVVWQDYNPYKKAGHWPKEFVIVDEGAVAKDKEPFSSKDIITSKLQHMLFPFPGAVGTLASCELEVTPLVQTGSKTGTVDFEDLIQMTPFGPQPGLNPNRRQRPTNKEYFLAVHVRGKVKPVQPMAGDEGAPQTNEAKTEEKSPPETEKPAGGETAKPEGDKPADEKTKPPAAEPPAEAVAEPGKEPAAPAKEPVPPADMTPVPPADKPAGEDAARPSDYTESLPEAPKPAEPKKPASGEINVILVADIDMLARDFFAIREQGDVPERDIDFDFDNVTFVLNVLDALAEEERFMDIRNRRPKHRTLVEIEEKTEKAREQTVADIEKFRKEGDDAEKREQDALKKKIEELKNRKNVDPQQMLIEVALAQEEGQARLDREVERFKRDRDRKINESETKLKIQVDAVRRDYKLRAVLLPPILPLLVALAVFITRRLREREGVSRQRLR